MCVCNMVRRRNVKRSVDGSEVGDKKGGRKWGRSDTQPIGEKEKGRNREERRVVSLILSG